MIVNIRITSDVDRKDLAVDDRKSLEEICMEENLALTTVVYVNGQQINVADAGSPISELPLHEGLNLVSISNKPSGGSH